jgi:methionyl-tRNA formyltransferase
VLFIEDEMDAGDLLSQLAVPVSDNDTASSLMASLAGKAAPFFADTLAAWVAGELIPQAQDHSQATWIDRMEKSAGRIDWSAPACELARRCRAFAPWPGSFTFFSGKRLLIHRARALPNLPESVSDFEPGTVVRTGDSVAVATGDGFLVLETVQLESRSALDIHDFVRGQRAFVGTRLD